MSHIFGDQIFNIFYYFKYYIWNINEYEGQKEGTFRFNNFYKQMAVAYGLGIRFDLDYLILRRLVGGTVSTFFGMVSFRTPSL